MIVLQRNSPGVAAEIALASYYYAVAAVPQNPTPVSDTPHDVAEIQDVAFGLFKRGATRS